MADDPLPRRPHAKHTRSAWLLVLGLVAAACNGRALATPTTEKPTGDAVVRVVDGVFDKKTLDLPVGQELLIVVLNGDDKVAHNLRFKTAPGDPKTKLERGPIVQKLTVRFDAPGNYRYTCDLHPLMTGVATVS